MVFLAAQTWSVFNKISVVPKSAYELKVVGYQFGFDMIYPEGIKTVNKLVLPEGPVKLLLTSRDVVHSFYIPAFKNKMDMIPGRTTYMYVLARPGKYKAYCAEYCGTRHSLMLADVEVKSKEEFQQWVQSKLAEAAVVSPVKKGEELVKMCTGCHSLTGEKAFGPTFKGIFGRQTELEDGTTVMVDEDYLKESIRNSNAKVVKGFPAAMPSYGPDQLTDKDIEAIIEYLKTLK